MTTQRTRRTYDIRGLVQGIGLRPTLCRAARRAGLDGWVQNRSGTVRLVLEGPDAAVRDFARNLAAHVPRDARIETVQELESRSVPDADALAGFRIAPSRSGDETEVVIPADLAVCPDCLAEIHDACDRRHGYAFTTCTLCGPRYTVVDGMPYDRERTTMSVFPLCDACRAEYEDPSNRRFHAESTACPVCGPRLEFHDCNGRPLAGDPLRSARVALADGGIVGVRGIGGFLLAADAGNADTVARLRERKCRPHKPFAVMAANLDLVRRCCLVPEAAERALVSSSAPIVILDVRSDADNMNGLALDVISPDVDTLGVMLPTTPLHDLLASPLQGDPVAGFDWLIMTSGNRRGEPICLTSDEAHERLDGIADFFLTHNREINLRNDDSLCALQCGSLQVWRRARGFAPRPIELQTSLHRCVLAMGAELKSTVSVAWDKRLVVSPHVGDLETQEALEGLEQVARALPKFLGRTPELVAVDLHPDMHATILGQTLAAELGIGLVEVQHHHAHAVACLSEHGHEEGLALVFDGTGLGSDATIWGAELLEVTAAGVRRLASFRSAPLPGGDAAVQRPVRQVVGRWHDAGIDPDPSVMNRLGISAEEASVWTQQCRQGLNAPVTHAAGRLFDAVACLLGFAPREITYEAQAAIRLETAARGATGEDVLPFTGREEAGLLMVDWRETFELLSRVSFVEGKEAGLALALHRAVADAATAMVEYGCSCSKQRHVALSGGVFMNRILTELLAGRLESMGLDVLVHRTTPPNDGCVSIGQALIAGRKGA